MKKVLCGLVLTLMMTGSVYSGDIDYTSCRYLKSASEFHISMAATGGGFGITEYEKKHIKDAHYFAVTWSAFCD